MEIKATDVKELREKTGAGLMDCKKALIEAEGDFKKAERLLKEMGITAAAKRSSRSTNEGSIFSFIEGNRAGLLELSCETDFVAMNKDFIGLGKEILPEIVKNDLKAIPPDMEKQLSELIGKLKENMEIRRFTTTIASNNELLVDYIHGNGRIGVIIKLWAEKPEVLKHEQVREFTFNCALHVAAFNPMFLSVDQIDKEYLTEQEEIFTKQALSLGKPEKIVPGIVKGKLNKHFSEICFLNQGFVKDDKQSVQKALETLGKEVSSKLSLAEYLYFRVGEEL